MAEATKEKKVRKPQEVVASKEALVADKLYRVGQVKSLFAGKSHNQVRALFVAQKDVQHGKAGSKVGRSSRYYLPGAAVVKLLA